MFHTISIFNMNNYKKDNDTQLNSGQTSSKGLPPNDAIQLLDVIPLEQLQSLQDKFSHANGVSSIILDLNGNPVTEMSRFIELCSSSYYHGQRCTGVEKLAGHAVVCHRPECRMSHARAPLYIDGKHVADWKIGMCGFGGIISPFIEAAYENITKFEEVHEKLSYNIKEHFESITTLLKAATEEITALGTAKVRQARELTEVKKQEELYLEKEDAFRCIFDNSKDGIALIGKEGEVKEWSHSVEKMSGISKPEAIGKKVWDLVYSYLSSQEYDEEQRQEMRDNLREIIVNKEQVTLVRHIVNLKTRQEIITQTVYFPLSYYGDAMMGSISRDITKEMHSEIELHVEKERLQSLSDNLPDGSLYQFTLNTKTQQTAMSYVGAQWESVTGVSCEDSLADINNLFSRIEPDDLSYLMHAIGESAKMMTKFNCEIRIQFEGSYRWLQLTSHPHLEGFLIVWNGIILDITERKRTEMQLNLYREKLEFQVKERTEQYEATNEELCATNEELYATNEELHFKNDQLHTEMLTRKELMQKLEESENKMRSFIEQSFEGIVIVDNDGRVTEWNPAQVNLTGILREEALGKYCWELFKMVIDDESMVNQYRKRVFTYLSLDDDGKHAIETEYVLSLPGGEVRYITIASFRMAMKDRVFMGEIVRETTERKLTEIELEQYRSLLEEMVENQTRKLTESNERLTSLSNNLPGGVIFQLSDKSSKIPQFSYISAHFETMFNVSIEDAMDDTSVFFRLLHPEDGEKLIDLITSSEQSKLVDIECRIILQTGESKWIHVRWSYHNLNDGTHLWDGFIIDITDKKVAELELEESRYRQNTLIKVLQIIQSAEDIGAAINEALSEAGKYANVSRSYIFEVCADGKTVNNTYEWCNEGINPEIENLQNVPKEVMQSWFDAFDRDEYICASNISMLPPEVFDSLDAQGIKSILVLPLTANGLTYGFIGFDECTHYKIWQRNDVELLISLSQIISTATRRFLAEKAIKLSQQTMHTVLDNINAAIYVADYETYELLFANKTLEDMMGGSLEGRLCYEALQGKNEPCEFCPKPKLLDENNKPTGEIYRWEENNKKLDRWFECSDAAIEWVDGRIVHMEYATDITDRRAAEEALRRSEEMYRQLMAASPDAITVCNTQGSIIYLSPRANELFLIPTDSDVNESSFTQYVHPHDMRRALEMFKSLVGGNQSVHPQLLLMREDGSEFFGEISSATVTDDDGNPTSVIMVIRDITERKISEMELIRAKEKAEESDKLKSAFLANMSHEIRTPINGINGFLSFIADENLSAKRRKEYLGIVHNSSAQLVRIIDDIIDIAKIEAQQLDIRPMTFHLNEFMLELHTFFETYLKTNKKDRIALILDDSQFVDQCNILSDPTRLRQVITNLLGNATKFTEKGFISFGYRPAPCGKLEFWIEDTGIGLPPNQLEVIFERFRQVELTHHRKYGGTGLGLTISRSLVQMMGGTIGVESVEGEGSMFKFTISYIPVLPIDEPVFAELRVEKPEDEQYFHGTTILVVESEPITLKYYEKMLTYNGATIISATNVAQWMELMNREKHINMVLVDACVFQNEDHDLIKNIKSMRTGLPIVLIVPQRDEYYNRIINKMQCTKVLEGRPDYETLCEEMLRII